MSIRTVACEKFLRALAKKHNLVAVRCVAFELGDGVMIQMGLLPRDRKQRESMRIDASGMMNFKPFYKYTVPFWKDFFNLAGEKKIFTRVSEETFTTRGYEYIALKIS